MAKGTKSVIIIHESLILLTIVVRMARHELRGIKKRDIFFLPFIYNFISIWPKAIM